MNDGTIATTTLQSENMFAQITNQVERVKCINMFICVFLQQYILYKDAGFQWTLFQPALIYFMLAIVGIPMNLSVC
jgi:hypothetical protein